MRSLRNCTLLISTLAVIAIPSRAQTSIMSGTVKVQHRPLSSAGVSAYLLDVVHNRTVSQWATTTTGDGSFALRSLPYGTYAVIVRYQGRIIYQSKLQLNKPAGNQLNIDVP